MAYTITQKPTTPNAAYTRLMYTVSGSTNTAKPQFQYMMDVFESGSSSLIKRSFQTINPAGVANFDPARIIQGELSQDNSWKISSLTPFENSSKVFTLKFGETYATSISSSAVIVDDVQQTNTEVFRGVVQPNNGISYNWQSSSYAVLSNMPATMSMQSDDYGTIGVYNNDVSYVSQSFYNGVNVISATKNYSITDNFSSVPISSSVSGWNYAEVIVSSSIGLQSYRYEVSDETHREKVRFAFINKLGTWDYFNNYNPVKQFIDVKREQYTAPRVDYSSLTSTYDIERRGLKDYHNSTDDEFTTETDYLDKTNANWLEELIESPSVYIQRNGEFLPIVITDSSYTANTNQARQKLFQYTINFKPANQPFGTWIPEYVNCPDTQTWDELVSQSSPYVWFDFSDTDTMTLSGSDNQIVSMSSKGTYDFEIVKSGPANPYPVYVGDYSSFDKSQGEMLISRTNLPILDTLQPQVTALTIYKPIFKATYTLGTAAIVYQNRADTTLNKQGFVYLANTGSLAGEVNYFSNTQPTANYSASGYLPISTGSFFSYSGSNSDNTWMTLGTINGSSGNNTYFVTRNSEATANISGSYVGNGGQGVLGFGAEPLGASGNAVFDIAHFILYDKVMTPSELQNIINQWETKSNLGLITNILGS